MDGPGLGRGGEEAWINPIKEDGIATGCLAF
jgi:hypothetical protein